MDIIDKATIILLLLMASAFAAVTYQLPSPANAGTVVGNQATFNWTTAAGSCDHSEFVLYNATTLFDNQTKACNDTLSLTNLTFGSYTWNVTEYDVSNAMVDQGVNQTFNVIPSVNATILYPPNNSAYGPNQCSVLTTLQVNVTGGSGGAPITTIWLYLNNGTNWILNQTKTLNGNGSVNFSGFSADGLYGVNSTTTQDGVQTTTGLTQFNILGTLNCANPPVADATVIFVDVLALIFVVWITKTLDDLPCVLLVIFVILGITTYGGLISTSSGLSNMNNIFIFLFLVYALGLLFGTLFMIIYIIPMAIELFNKKGNNA